MTNPNMVCSYQHKNKAKYCDVIGRNTANTDRGCGGMNSEAISVSQNTPGRWSAGAAPYISAEPNAPLGRLGRGFGVLINCVLPWKMC